MCGIIGLINFQDGEQLAKQGLEETKNRGKDNTSLIKVDKNFWLGHNLHSIVSFVEQPIFSKEGCLVANCEIYNWRELNQKYSLSAKNDAELILSLIELKGIQNALEIINELDGDFVFAYYNKKQKILVLGRDVVGVKPLVYFHEKRKFGFASEKKALPVNSIHLNPRQVLFFNANNGKVITKKVKIFSKNKNEKQNNFDACKNLLQSAVGKRIPEKKFGLLLSGGLDSSLIGKILKKNSKQKFNCYFSCIDSLGEPKDLAQAKQMAKLLGQKLFIERISLEEFEQALPKIISIIESIDPIRVGVASTIYFATRNAFSNGDKVIFSGLGADELFAGYSRFNNSNDINKDCYSYFIKLYENDLYFEDLICMSNNLELRVPFLDKALTEFALNLDAKLKIKNKVNKFILRECAHSLDLPKEIAFREKRAAQYGSNFDKALEKLAKKNKFKSKTDYLKSIGIDSNNNSKHSRNISIGALVSTGKDSLYALHLMQKQGYKVKCLITIESRNPDSFMYHTPTIKLAKLQSKTLSIPLILVKTSGKKELELKELEKAIGLAKKRFKIEGVCSGALFSNYQRERIEKICENLGIRSFAPLWHFEQKQYLQRVITENFEVIITKIACYGLSEKWLGRRIDAQAIRELEQLEKKFRINVAGEGGEYETLVLNAPMFSKKIVIGKAKTKMENEFTGELLITKAKLINFKKNPNF